MRLFLIILLISLHFLLSAQDTNSAYHSAQLYQVVEQMPQYPGGNDSMTDFIKNNLKYPDSIEAQHIGGRVVLGFIVNEDGNISDIAVRKSINPTLDTEAIRVVKLFPKFKPGKQQGRTVSVMFVLPIIFGRVNAPRKHGSLTYRDKYPDK
jgi:TonB family protein